MRHAYPVSSHRVLQREPIAVTPSLLFRVSDSREWASPPFRATTARRLCAAIRRAWETYVLEMSPRLEIHPAFALQARMSEIDAWLDRRGGSPEQERSWRSQWDHWRWQARERFGHGPEGPRLDLQVLNFESKYWLNPNLGQAIPFRVTYDVEPARCEKAISNAARIWQHDLNLSGLGSAVVDVLEHHEKKRAWEERQERRRRLGLRIVPKRDRDRSSGRGHV